MNEPQTLTYEFLKKLEEEMTEFEAKMPKDWMLVSPDGRVWRGSLKDITMTAAQEHLKQGSWGM